MAKIFIGREQEKSILERALQSDEAEMISVIGRRRVGKTFLINSVYGNKIDFEVTGIQNATRNEQLKNFSSRLKQFAPMALISPAPKDWLDAFFLLISYLEQKNKREKMLVFFDELPWLATHRSGFLKGLSYFWNSWAVKQHIVVVICGSAASWMIDKVLRHKGGLYNRVTKRIHLKSFSLAETKKYLEHREVYFDNYQLLQIYMAIGGIPHYLKEIKHGKSAIQNIEQLCFSDSGILYNEFLGLYPSLFDHADKHIAVIRALASKRYGLNRKDLVATAGFTDGGSITKVLEELAQSGFISSYYPFGKKKKDKLYRLTDEYSLFYLQFIEKNTLTDEAIWQQLSQTQEYKVWCGYAFENICLKHIQQIKKAMGISGIYSTSASFLKKGTKNETGTQIDLVIDRNDHVINLFEIKFYNSSFSITKEYAQTLRKKIQVFRESTKTSKQIFISFISTFGLQHNQHSIGLIHDNFDINILFQE